MVSEKTASRALREKKTVEAMIAIYRRGHHGRRRVLCESCLDLLGYAETRIDCCPFIENKPTCAKCTVHCYEKSRRENIRAVMRYAGPRMILRHPILTVWHTVDSKRS